MNIRIGPGLLIMICIVLSSIPIMASSDPASPPTTTRSDIDRIFVEGNAAFSSFASLKALPGSGSANDPYIIRDADIDSDRYGCCVYIADTSFHINIVNCCISGASEDLHTEHYSGVGMYLENARNLRIDGCSFTENEVGSLFLDGCSDIEVYYNDITGSTTAVKLTDCGSIEMKNNSIHGSGNGVYVHESSRVTFLGNVLSNSSANGLVVWDSHHLDVMDNLFLRNTNYGVSVFSSDNISVHGNSFCYNRGSSEVFNKKLCQSSSNSRDNITFSREGKGNHWRDRLAPDEDKDGLIDITYNIDGSVIKDEHPLARSSIPSPPSAPTQLSLSQNISGVQIGWEPPLDNGGSSIQEYLIMRSLNEDPFRRIGSVDGSINAFFDDTAYQGNQYGYLTIPINSFGQGHVSEIASLVKDSLPPIFTQVGPERGSYHISDSVTVTWQAYDSDSGVAEYHIRVDNGTWQILGNVNSYLVKGLTSGEHTVDILAVDEAGNQKMTSINFYVDFEPPRCEIIQPADGSYYSTGEVLVETNVSDPSSEIINSQISIDGGDWEYLDIGLVSSTYVLEDGPHTIKVRVEDGAGNKVTEMVTFIVDTVQPELMIITPSSPHITNKRNVLITWETDDGLSGIETVTAYIDGDAHGLDVTGVREHGLVGLIEGKHLVRLVTADRAGNEISDEVHIMVDTIPPGVVKKLPVGSENLPESTISITFDEMVDDTSINLTLNGAFLAPLISADLRTVTAYPADLIPGYEFDVVIAVSDLAGNTMPPLTWSFKVRSVQDILKGQVKGRVMDDKGRPIEDALVKISQLEVTRTNENGFFFHDLDPGFYNMTITADGYESQMYFFNITGGENTDTGFHFLVTAPKRVEDRTELPVVPIFLAIVILLITFGSIVIITQVNKEVKGKEESEIDPVEEERKRLYSKVEIPADLAEAFMQMPDAKDLEAMFRVAPEVSRQEIDGTIYGDELGRMDAPEITTEDVRGLDLSILDDGMDEMDWSELGNPLYDDAPDDTTPMEDMDCYRKLGVSGEASSVEIRKAYRRLVALYHPDRIGRFDPLLQRKAQEEMKRINYAKEILLNEDNRQEYDQMLLESAKSPLM